MVRWKIYIGDKQRGNDYDNEKRAIEKGLAMSTSFKQVFVYKTVNGGGPVQVAKWVDRKRVA